MTRHDFYPERLSHRAPTCSGNWRLVQDNNRLIRCDRCAVTYPADPLNRLAGIDENYAGIYLRRLATEGARLLDAERRPS